MPLSARRAHPLARGRVPFAHPRSARWRSGEPRWTVLALVAAPVAVISAVRAALARGRSGGRSTEVIAAGYRARSTREQAAVNLLGAFLLTLGAARGVNYGLEQRRPVRLLPSRAAGEGDVHHSVPGIALVLASGAAGLLAGDRRADPWVAFPFGSGAALVLDEIGLLLELRDVYWRSEQIVVAQGVTALAAAVALALRLVRKGEKRMESGPTN